DHPRVSSTHRQSQERPRSLPPRPPHPRRHHPRRPHGQQEGSRVRFQRQGDLVVRHRQPLVRQPPAQRQHPHRHQQKAGGRSRPQRPDRRETPPRRYPGLQDRRLPDRHPPAQRQHPRQQLGQRLEHHRRPL